MSRRASNHHQSKYTRSDHHNPYQVYYELVIKYELTMGQLYLEIGNSQKLRKCQENKKKLGTFKRMRKKKKQ